MINFHSKKDFANQIENLLKNDSCHYFCHCDNEINKTSKFFNQRSLIQTGYSPLVIDDFDVYLSFFENLQKIKSEKDIDGILKIIQKTILDYFGYGVPNEAKRILLYKLFYEKEENVSIKNFYQSGNAWCLENASLCHNLLKILGFKTCLCACNVNINGKIELHAFNIVEIKNKKYIFDLISSSSSKDVLPPYILNKIDVDDSIFDESTKINNIRPQDCLYNSQNGKSYFITYFLKTPNKEFNNNDLCF